MVSISAGAAVGQGRLRCTTRVPRPRTLLAHTPKSRAAFPRSTEEKDLLKQGAVPEQIETEFSSHGGEFAIVDLADAFPVYTTVPGVVVSWEPYKEGVQEWQWGLPSGKPTQPIELGFASFWRTTGAPAAKISCKVEGAAGSATVRTEGEIEDLLP